MKKTLGVITSLAPAKAVAASTTVASSGIAAALTATSLGIDPAAWGIGAAGATVVFAYKRANTVSKIIANGVICLFFGGVVAPHVGVFILHLWHIEISQYILSGILSAGWPWMIPIVRNFIRIKFEGGTIRVIVDKNTETKRDG